MKRLFGFLVALTLSAASYGATAIITAPVQNVTLKHSGNTVVEKIFLNFNVPSLPGATITAAVLHMNCNAKTGSGISGIVSYVSEDATWTEASSGSTLLSLSLLGTNTATTNVTATGDVTWDVLGTTNGVKQCYADGKTAITFRLDGPSGSDTVVDNVTLFLQDNTGTNSATFDKKDGATPASLVITYTPAASTRKHKAVIKGKGF